MPTSGPAPSSRDPNLFSNQTDPPDHVSSPTVDIPPDPLLQSGSFIDVNTPTTAPGPAPAPAPAPAPGGSTTTTSAQTPNKKDKKSANPVTSNGAGPEITPLRRPSVAAAPETLTWLPAGWSVEDRVRSSGATAGLVDRYYFDPGSGRRFRSKKEVLHFLETGTPTPRKRKKGMENSDANVDSLGSSGSNKQKSGARGKSAAPNFDYINAPEKIQWVLTGNSEDSWTPFVGKDKVPEYVRRDWVAAFTYLTTNNGGSTMF